MFTKKQQDSQEIKRKQWIDRLDKITKVTSQSDIVSSMSDTKWQKFFDDIALYKKRFDDVSVKLILEDKAQPMQGLFNAMVVEDTYLDSAYGTIIFKEIEFIEFFSRDDLRDVLRLYDCQKNGKMHKIYGYRQLK